MNRKEHLITCLIEELGEVQKELSKCLRFTCDHKPDVYPTTNIERAQLEVIDVYAVADLLHKEGINTGIQVPKALCPDHAWHFLQKQEKVERLMEHAKNIGALC